MKDVRVNGWGGVWPDYCTGQLPEPNRPITMGKVGKVLYLAKHHCLHTCGSRPFIIEPISALDILLNSRHSWAIWSGKGIWVASCPVGQGPCTASLGRPGHLSGHGPNQ